MKMHANSERMRATEREERPKETAKKTTEKEKDALERFRSYAESLAREAVAAARDLMGESDRRIAGMIADAVKENADADTIQRATEVAKPASKFLIGLQEKYRWFMPAFLAIGLAGQLERLTHPPVDTGFEKRHEAAEQLEKTGLTDERRDAYMPGISETLYRSIIPFSYGNMIDLIQGAPGNFSSNREEVVKSSGTSEWRYEKSEHQDREDAWRLYLGLPQEYRTFGVSEFQPQDSKDDAYYYKINGWLEQFIASDQGNALRYDAIGKHMKPIELIVRSIDAASQVEVGESVPREVDGIRSPRLIFEETRAPGSSIITEDRRVRSQDSQAGGVMGNFRLSKGHDAKGDYISYYDKWDLGVTIEGENGLFGKPFEIYDRVYYDPVTFEQVQPG